MNSREAKDVLLTHRPELADAEDPRLAEALEQAQRDPELANWFEGHCTFQAAVRDQLRRIPVPESLRERILAQRPTRVVVFNWWRKPVALAAAATVLLIALASFWFRVGEDTGLGAYRSRMVRSVLRDYRVDLITTNEAEIRAFLTTNQAQADYALPPGLAKIPLTGCGVLSWQGNRVAMLCFGSSGRTDLWVFVIPRSAIPDAPPRDTAEWLQVKKLMTASWILGDKLYVLAGLGDVASLRRLLSTSP